MSARKDTPARRAAREAMRAARLNAQAEFLPFGRDGNGPPAIQIGGALVFAYVQGGELCISADLDGAADALGDPVPMRITVQGGVVWAAGRNPHPAASFSWADIKALVETADELYGRYGDPGDILSRRQKELLERARQATQLTNMEEGGNGER